MCLRLRLRAPVAHGALVTKITALGSIGAHYSYVPLICLFACVCLYCSPGCWQSSGCPYCPRGMLAGANQNCRHAECGHFTHNRQRNTAQYQCPTGRCSVVFSSGVQGHHSTCMQPRPTPALSLIFIRYGVICEKVCEGASKGSIYNQFP